jgi:hypothetical protein
MAHGCGLTSVRGNRGENYEKGTAGSPKTYKEKKKKHVPVTNPIFFYLKVKNEPCVHRADAFILEFSTIANNNM